FCRERAVPAIYRRQPAPSDLPAIPAEGAQDPLLVRQVRRGLRRSEIGLVPGPHASLGLPAYVQATSPLRRYQDLVVHRQIAAVLAGTPTPYGIEQLQRIAATTDAAEGDARRAERAADDYWMLRFLEGQRERELEARVVEVEPRTIVQLVETLWEQPLGSLAAPVLGATLRTRIERVNPRAGLLVLRAVDGLVR
ncbi:MAG TPA: RNB domain-containing ribonuclease, partial [Candidatus Polarisedimenticolaceae bacterium]|nr:RNB domain-containing ribonuclease [Candidatus Polarisedimenticolaceae bacterium]